MQEKHLTILGIDDNEGDLILLQRALEEIPGLTIDLRQAYNGKEGLEALDDGEIDVIFLDFFLGAESGMDVLTQIRARGDRRALIVLTGMASASLAVNLTHAGADDYLDKNAASPDLLRRAIDNAQAQQRRRMAFDENKRLLSDIQGANRLLEQKNARLAELYNTAHQFVDNVSHEFRTPLAVIKEYASLLHDGILGDINDEQKEFLDVIGNRVEDLALMVDDMLDISRFGAGMMHVNRGPTQVREITEHVLPSLDRRASINKVQLKIEVQGDLPLVYCDSEKVGRTIINLAVNAIKFAPEEGLVRIAARHDTARREVVIEVIDNGPGISPENRRLIFERFKQIDGDLRQSTKGFGLGLNIARELVHVNFGRITLESEVGQGSTFMFTLPTADPDNIIERYLNWLAEVEQPAAVSLIWAKTRDVAEPNVLETVGAFLRKQARPRDLLFSPASGVWLLVAQCELAEQPTLVERFKQARDEANRNRPTGQLAEVEYEVISTWQCPAQARELVERFLEAMKPSEVAYG